MKRVHILILSSAALLAACGEGSSSKSGSAASSPAAGPQANGPSAVRVAGGADLKNGEAEFSLCRSCHTIVKDGADMTGPNLYGVVGRKIASKAGFAYSSALRAKAGVWDDANLNAWLTSPSNFAPGTKMSFPGLKDEKDRRDVIAYVKSASGG